MDWTNNSFNVTDFHSGSKSLEVGPGDRGRAQAISTLIPGSTYTLSAWGILSGAGFVAPEKAYIGVELRDAGNARISTPGITITDSLE